MQNSVHCPAWLEVLIAAVYIWFVFCKLIGLNPAQWRKRLLSEVGGEQNRGVGETVLADLFKQHLQFLCIAHAHFNQYII